MNWNIEPQYKWIAHSLWTLTCRTQVFRFKYLQERNTVHRMAFRGFLRNCIINYLEHSSTVQFVSVKIRFSLEATEQQRFLKIWSSVTFLIQHSFFDEEVWTIGQGIFSEAARQCTQQRPCCLPGILALQVMVNKWCWLGHVCFS